MSRKNGARKTQPGAPGRTEPNEPGGRLLAAICPPPAGCPAFHQLTAFSSQWQARTERICPRSEVVMQQHAARRKDWAAWQVKEEELCDEIRELSSQVQAEQQERDQAVGRETILEQELRAERRRRIDLEAQITLADTWKAEAAAADRAARLANSNSALAAATESEAAREWKRQAAEARRAEAKASAAQHRAELAAQNARKELNRHLEEREQQFQQRVQQARASEAEVLAEAWRMSGELRSELDAVRTSDRSDRPSEGSSARQALQDLRELRQRYTDMLGP